jgi:hypothetical protein
MVNPTPPPAYAAPRLNACNYIDIVSEHRPITGSWILDTSLVIPEFLLAPISDGETRPNLSLSGKGPTINAEVELAGWPNSHDRALLVLNNIAGNLVLKLVG